MSIKGKPDVSSFLDGGKAEEQKPSPAPAPVRAAAAPKQAEKAAAVPKRQKLVELPEPIYNALKDRAYEDFKRTGRRVTETEIIIAALTKYLKL